MVATDESGGETRYRLHETMRQYARERLDAVGEADAVRCRHAEYYIALAENAQTRYRSRYEDWPRTVDQEFANLAAALDVRVPQSSVEKPTRFIFHIAFESDWKAAEQSGTYRGSTRGARLDDVGFVHAGFEHQVSVVGGIVYRDASEPLVVLVIDTEHLDVPVVVENLEGGDEMFPHIYGPLPVRAVVDVLAAVITPDGRFVVREPRDGP
jgi:uncharacterized protein (DUF952 family)